MCFTISNKPKYSQMRIAKRDIPCYKNLHKLRHSLDNKDIAYRAPYRYDAYFNDFTNPVTKEAILHIYNTGLHIYNTGFDGYIGYIAGNREINKGLHCYSDKREAIKKLNYDETTTFKAIIPKGTKYYYNPIDKQYVAEKLTVYPVIIKNFNTDWYKFTFYSD